MAVRCPVPSQESAYRYADSILDRRNVSSAKRNRPALCSAGIPKAATWRYMRPCKSRKAILKRPTSVRNGSDCCRRSAEACRRNCRISRIFSHDGPGMSQVMVHSAYQAIAARIDKTVPESSIIGMLLQSQIKPTFVKADAISIRAYGIELAGDAIRRIRAGRRADRRCATSSAKPSTDGSTA